MSDVTIAIGESELQRIGDYVRGHLFAWLNDMAPQVIVGPQLLERTVRIEEELKSLRETMETRFAAQQALTEERKRFEAQQETMKADFAAADKRFEAQQAMMKASFAAADKRFDSQQAIIKTQQWIVIAGFVVLGTLISILGLAA